MSNKKMAREQLKNKNDENIQFNLTAAATMTIMKSGPYLFLKDEEILGHQIIIDKNKIRSIKL